MEEKLKLAIIEKIKTIFSIELKDIKMTNPPKKEM
jgi:hypothetical protein